MDHAVPLKQQGSSDFPDFMCPNLEFTTDHLRDWLKGKLDDRPQPERNGVTRHLLLPQINRHKETLNTRKILLYPRKYFQRALMTESKSSPLSPSTKLSKDRTVNSSKRGILGLSNKVRKNEKVQDIQPWEWRTRKERPCNPLTLSADGRASKKGRLPGEMFVRGQLKRLKRRSRQTPKNERQIPVQ